MAKAESVNLSDLVKSITNYAPSQSGLRSMVFEFADKALLELKKAGVKAPFQRAAIANLARKDETIVAAMEKAGIHKSDRYNRVSMYIGHWIVKSLKNGLISIHKDDQKRVWLTIV